MPQAKPLPILPDVLQKITAAAKQPAATVRAAIVLVIVVTIAAALIAWIVS